MLLSLSCIARFLLPSVSLFVPFFIIFLLLFFNIFLIQMGFSSWRRALLWSVALSCLALAVFAEEMPPLAKNNQVCCSFPVISTEIYRLCVQKVVQSMGECALTSTFLVGLRDRARFRDEITSIRWNSERFNAYWLCWELSIEKGLQSGFSN